MHRNDAFFFELLENPVHTACGVNPAKMTNFFITY
ncbi:Crp/Fnr family transcriptional regulator [Listeria monocytogenes]|nr:Crp/Fnr family transcriptional regulator [Listeria monocytogenes]